MRFHRRCGDRVTLLNDNTTAIRNFVEFNHGLILSAEPLKDDSIFEVSIDRKVNVWNGSLEIGVTTLDPEFMDLPATATKLRNSAWILSGNSIVKDGATIVNSYGPELDSLCEGDTLGVMRSSKGELIFYQNGRCLGIAVRDLPPRLFAVIDLYGQCVQVSITPSSPNGLRPIMESSLDQIEEDPNNDDTLTPSEGDGAGLPLEDSSYSPKEPRDIFIPITSEGACALVAQDRLRFHPRCGILVKLSANNKSAERARPMDDYNNGVVMTHRPLYDNELFEIRIDRLVDKWSGSIEVGVTTHNPATIRFPSTMTNMDTGTVMMSGIKVLRNGHGTSTEYGNFNLDELREGDTVGLMRKSNGKLHYFINGVDQGVATDKVEPTVWGVVDLYGMTVKVSIVDPSEELDSNINSVPAPQIATPDLPLINRLRPRIDEDSLLFHTLRDSNVIIINDGKTAHRPNAFEYFNNGIVMTNRTLRTGELFQVRLDLVVPKWAGSIEIGVTQHSSSDILLPFKLSNAKSGTWAMTGEDIIRDGTIIIPQYVRNLNRLVEGDTVGVMRKDIGILHFFVNGLDQGPAAFNIPEHVFGIIDLYGRVAQATIVDSYSPPPTEFPESPLSTESNVTVHPNMTFHRVHGRNARLSRSRVTASRDSVYSEFNDAVLFSARPLRECDMFELVIDKMVDFWIGSLEIGVTAIRPDDLEPSGVAGTATDLNRDTYILSGAAMMKDGECVRSGYPLDLDTLVVGSRVGMMWHADRSLHYYLDGMDMGKAWFVPHLNIYAVVDLYGQCTQVTILQNEERTFNYNGCTNYESAALVNHARALSSPPYWSFSEYKGANVRISNDYTIATRLFNDQSGALCFSSSHLAVGELFEIKLLECKTGHAGNLRIGVTDIDILNAHVNRGLPASVKYLPHYTAYIEEKYIKYTRPDSREKDKYAFSPSTEWLRPGDRIGLQKAPDARVWVYLNSECSDEPIENVPDKVFVVIELCGDATKIQAVPRGNAVNTQITIPNDDCSKLSLSTMVNNGSTEAVSSEAAGVEETPGEPAEEAKGAEVGEEEAVPAADDVTAAPKRPARALPYTFHCVHGDNIKLCSSDTVAMRVREHQQGIAVVSQRLMRGYSFRFRVDKLSSEWFGSAAIGAVSALPAPPGGPCGSEVAGGPPLPDNALLMRHVGVWLVSAEILIDNGQVTASEMAAALEELRENSVLTLHFKWSGQLWLEQDGRLLGAIATIPRIHCHVFPLIDLYGKVAQVSILLHPYALGSGASLDLPIITENLFGESLALAELEGDNLVPRSGSPDEQSAPKLTPTSASLENLIEETFEPFVVQAGPSTSEPLPIRLPNVQDLKNKENKSRKCPNQLALHHSLMEADLPATNSLPTFVGDIKSNDVANRSIQKSQSTQSFTQHSEELLTTEFKDAIKQTMSLDARLGDDGTELMVYVNACDTNIRHNDRYPEAADVDNLDNEIMDALTLETGNLPDLTEEQSSSIDESTRRDDLWSETLSVENLNYLNRILCLDQEGAEGNSLESEWEASGENCEHLHLVLKYWHFLVLPFPELRRAVSWGQVRCYCANCQPDALAVLAGWVRIERIDGVGACRTAFWHVARHTLGSATAHTGAPRRPRSLTPNPCFSPAQADIWFDEEGKPHQTVLAIEIDVEGTAAENDRLLAFLIYLKPHLVFIDDPSSPDE